MLQEVPEIVRRICEIAPMLHTAGPVSPKVINAIYRRVRKRCLDLSMETGSGATTLLLSHLSNRHLVFAKDDGSGSVKNVCASKLLNRSSVDFIEGPTQRTLPRFIFPRALQFALLDGPHAYPFPDLEYFHVYPSLEPGALLVLDDIHIKTIHNLFSFLQKDVMFRLDDVVETTAFFTRTDAPAFCTTGDGWQEQGFNKALLRRYCWSRQTRDLIPRGARKFVTRVLRTFQTGCKLWIDKPEGGAIVGNAGLVCGRVKGNTLDRFLWVLIRLEGQTGWWPQGGGPATVDGGAWECAVEYGGGSRDCAWFEIAAILVNSSINSYLLEWRVGAVTSAPAPIEGFPFRSASIAETHRRVKRCDC